MNISTASKLTVGNWIDNSFGPDFINGWNKDFVNFNYAVLVIMSIILLHSFYLHRSKWPYVRICNDISAVSVFAMSCFYIRCAVGDGCSVFDSAMMIDLGVNSIFTCFLLIAENYMTWKRYAVLQNKITNSEKIITLIYVIVNLYGCWLPFFTIVPFFVNMNNKDAINIFIDCQLYWNLPASLLYNLFFDSHLAYKMYQTRKQSAPTPNTNLLDDLSWKAMFHSICSCVGIFLYSFYRPRGRLIQVVLYSISIHVIFNRTNASVMRVHSMGTEKFLNARSVRYAQFDVMTTRIGATTRRIEGSHTKAVQVKSMNVTSNCADQSDPPNHLKLES